MVGQKVVVRTCNAGVHFGTLVSRSGTECQLADARRIWRWRGANTLHEVSLHGIDKVYSRISEAVPEIELTEVIEVIPASEVAAINLGESRWPN